MHKNKSPKHKLMPLPLPLLTLSLAGCASKPAAWQPEQVSAPAVPVLPREARQLDNLPWCSPSWNAAREPGGEKGATCLRVGKREARGEARNKKSRHRAGFGAVRQP